MDGYDEDEPDGLVQATFTIPCSSSSHLDQPNGGAFPILPKYERNAGPSTLRRRGFLAARKQAVRAFENTFCGAFDPVIDDIESFCVEGQSCVSSFFIPGSSSGDTPKRLPVASLVGPQVSQGFYHRLKNRIQGQRRYRLVSLQPRDCLTLAASVRLLVAQLMDEEAILDAAAIGISSLSTLPPSTIVIVYLRSIALHKYAVLNDFLKALHSAAQTEGFPRIVVLLGAEGGVGSLDEKVDSESMRLMDLHRISMPSPSMVFDTMMEELFFTSDAQSTIWLGPSVLETLRYQYFERGFDLDKILSTIELAIHHHFTTRSISSIAAMSTSEYDVADWKPAFFDRLRVHIVEVDGQGNINLPPPTDGRAVSKQQYLHSILTDDGALLESMQDFSSASIFYRANMRRAIRLLHSLRCQFLNQAGADAEEAMHDPRRTRLGGLTWHILCGEGMKKQVGAVIGAVKKAPMRKLQDALEAVKASDWSKEDTVFQEKLAVLQSEVLVEVERETHEEPDVGVDLSEEQHMERVHKRLLREESSDAVRRRVAEWIRAAIETWAGTRPVLPQVWTYDYSSYLTQLTDPSPRGTILAALNDPSSAARELEGDSLPDVCRLYQQYQSAGKMINLYDLYQAFTQSTQATATSSNKKRRLNGAETDGMQRKDAIQARFALAVNEMGRMGFLKKTRRKPDHVLKIIHDLPSTNTV